MTTLFTKKELSDKTGDAGSKLVSTETFSKILDAVDKFHKLGSSPTLMDVLNVLNRLKELTNAWQNEYKNDASATAKKKKPVVATLQQQIDSLINEHQQLSSASIMTKKELSDKTGDAGSKLVSTETFSKILDAVDEFHKLGLSPRAIDVFNVLNRLKELTNAWQNEYKNDTSATAKKKKPVVATLQQQIDSLISKYQPSIMTHTELEKATGYSGSFFITTSSYEKIIDALKSYGNLKKNASGKETYAALERIKAWTGIWLTRHKSDRQTEATQKRPHIEKLQQQVVDEIKKYATYSSSAGAYLTDRVIESLEPIKEGSYTSRKLSPQELKDELFNFINDGGLGAKGQHSYTFQTLGKKVSVSGSGKPLPFLNLEVKASGSGSDYRFLYMERQSGPNEKNTLPVAFIGMEGVQYEAEIGATLKAGIDNNGDDDNDNAEKVELMSLGLSAELAASVGGTLGCSYTKASVAQPIYAESPLSIREPVQTFLLKQKSTEKYSETHTNYINLLVGKSSATAKASAGAGANATLIKKGDNEVGLSASFGIESNINGQLNLVSYRIQTTDNNAVNKTQDTFIKFKQIGGKKLGIGAELKGALKATAKSGNIGTEKEKEISIISASKEKTFELLNSIEYTTGIAYWKSSNNGCQVLEGTGLVRGHSVSMPSIVKYFKESKVQDSKFPVQYVQTLAKTLHVSAGQLKRFLDASEDLLNALGYDPGFNPKALIIEASFVPSEGDNLPEIATNKTDKTRLNDIRTAMEKKKNLQPQMLKLRYRMEDEDNSDAETFSLGFKIGVARFNLSLEKIDRAGKRALIDLFNYQLASTAAEEIELNKMLTPAANEVGRTVLLF